MGEPLERPTHSTRSGACTFLKLVVQVTTLGCCTAFSATSRSRAPGATPLAFVPRSRAFSGRQARRCPSSATSVSTLRGRYDGRRVTVTPTASLGRQGARWATKSLFRSRKTGSSLPSRISATVAPSLPTVAAQGAGLGQQNSTGPSVNGARATTVTYAAGTMTDSAPSSIAGGDVSEASRVGWRRGEDWRSSPASAATRSRRRETTGSHYSTTLETSAAISEAGTAFTTVGGEEGDGDAGEAEQGGDSVIMTRQTRPRLRFGVDLTNDFKRRAALYKSDWKDGWNQKSLPAIMFLYFACLLPAVAFGGIASQVTQGSLGVIEYLVSCGVGGMAYAVLSGQPMTFIGPTGLTLAFITALYSFTSVAGLPFLPVYSWVGLWTSGMLMTLAAVGASNLIEYATQFTDDVFNALLSVNFVFEACRSLQRNFTPGVAGYSQAGALMSLNVALVTYAGCRKTSGARDSRYFTSGSREFLSDFGPLLVIISMSIFCAFPAWSGLLSFLEVPTAFMLGQGRSWLVPLLSVGPGIRMACALPAMLLTSLFFLDQNISSRVVNSPRHKMVKGPAYHQDMLVLGMITGALSLLGLPWQCAATVQSLNHVRQMATLKATTSPSGSKSEEIVSIHETRATGFCVHALVLGSLGLLPHLARIPMSVVAGIFLYLGRKVMSGNGFLIRIKDIVADKSMLTPESDVKRVGFKTALRYTGLQMAMLSLLWTLKSFKQTALFFPSVIGLLIVVRLGVLPKMFSPKELDALDAAVG